MIDEHITGATCIRDVRKMIESDYQSGFCNLPMNLTIFELNPDGERYNYFYIRDGLSDLFYLALDVSDGKIAEEVYIARVRLLVNEIYENVRKKNNAMADIIKGVDNGIIRN